MLGQLFIKECRQTTRSLIFWLIVLILVWIYASQLGETEIKNEPMPGQESYGLQISQDPELIMRSTLKLLTEEYFQGNYTTYPVGFYKNVTLNEEENRRIGEILEATAGIGSREEAGRMVEAWYGADSEICLEPAEGLTYDQFNRLMDEVDGILGGGSSYSEQKRRRNAKVPMTYEDAVEEYRELIEEDRLTGGYARMFCDYMGIFLGVLPVFLAVARGLRDRRARMQELIYTRKCSSLTVITSRYLSMIVMLTVPVLALSMVLLQKCIIYAGAAGIGVDMLAFVKYTCGWLLPSIMIVTALGMLLTELTNTAVAVLVQGDWWFIAMFTGIHSLGGGQYGWSLVPRHNTEMNWQGFHDGFGQLAANRAFYAAAALVIVALTAFVYSQKRKGKLGVYGKILANRKNES